MRLRHCGTIVNSCMKEDGSALEYQYAYEALRNDREIVQAAVEGDARAVEYASEALRNDCEIHAEMENTH